MCAKGTASVQTNHEISKGTEILECVIYPHSFKDQTEVQVLICAAYTRLFETIKSDIRAASNSSHTNSLQLVLVNIFFIKLECGPLWEDFWYITIVWWVQGDTETSGEHGLSIYRSCPYVVHAFQGSDAQSFRLKFPLVIQMRSSDLTSLKSQYSISGSVEYTFKGFS